ncbi:MAG TPA: GGDEF domain-containing response regulator [Longimicrobiales bacterium]|nr:GGDEF domain-containing response regulator [Longimicrobiales bacterium]
MSTRPLHVLLIEPEEASAERIRGFLEGPEETLFRVDQVRGLSAGLEKLSHGGIDVILLDLELPDSEGLVTFERMYAFAPDVPIVVLTEIDDDELALASVQSGAQDFLVQREVTATVLTRSIRYAVERHRLLSALRSLSLIDDLTGLYNRRGFSDLGEQYLKLARRTGRSATLIFLDVDRFKTINDTLGHHMGDRALLRIADILRQTFRRSDIIGRLGGDEFAVLAPESSGDPPEVLVHRVKGAVKDFDDSSPEPYRLSVSVGVARFDGDALVRLDDLLAEADSAMYEEKRAKRRVVSG